MNFEFIIHLNIMLSLCIYKFNLLDNEDKCL